MVAPISLCRPTRVFSRLPHTGEDKGLPAVCCDLSRTASIAPAHPLPRSLLNGTKILADVDFSKSNEETEKKIQLAKITSDSSNTSPIMSEVNSQPSAGSKRPFMEEGDEPAKKMKSSPGSIVAMTSLMTENLHLKQQNEMLRRKLVAFQHIMRQEENYLLALKKVKEMDTQNISNAI